MCQAVQEMCDDARAEGRTQGFTEGESIGLEKSKKYKEMQVQVL